MSYYTSLCDIYNIIDPRETPIHTEYMEEKIVYQGTILEMVERRFERDGKTIVHERARRTPGSRTLILSGDGQVLLSREHRFEIDDYDYHLPGGKVFDRLTDYNDFLATEPDKKTLVKSAKRGAVLELKEEMGLTVLEDDLEFAYLSPCGSTVDWDLYYFICRVKTTELGAQDLGSGENVEPVWLSTQEAYDIALDGTKMHEDRSAAFVLRSLAKILG